MAGIDKLITVTLDKERHLRLPLEGLLEFEKLTGKNLLKGFNLADFSLADNAALVFACLLHEDKELTYEDVLGLVDINNLTTVMTAVTECINQATPEVKPDKSPLVRGSKKRRRG